MKCSVYSPELLVTRTGPAPSHPSIPGARDSARMASVTSLPVLHILWFPLEVALCPCTFPWSIKNVILLPSLPHEVGMDVDINP